MPTLIRKSPSELKGYEKAKKRVHKIEKESNLSSGFSGTPLADSQTYDALVKSFDELQTELEAYQSGILIFVASDGSSQEPNNPNDLIKQLNKTGQIINKISLGALTPRDIQVLKDYEMTTDGYYTTLEAQIAPILTIAGLRGPRGGQPRLRGEAIADTIQNVILPTIDELFRNLDAKIVSFNSGKAQPMKVGGALICHEFDPYNSLKGHPMYQTSKYAI